MEKEFVYSIHFNHSPKKGFGFPTTWSKAYPERLEAKDILSYLEKLKNENGAFYADILTSTVEVDEDGYFDFDECSKITMYKWKNNELIKEKEIVYD